MENEDRQTMAPCSECRKRTWHNVLHAVETNTGHGLVYRDRMIECAGCRAISLEHSQRWLDDKKPWSVQYFPSPATREVPEWVFDLQIGALGGDEGMKWAELFGEINAAMCGGQHRLALMGIRALLEQVMISKIGDQGSFAKNLNKFCEGGYISIVQRDVVDTVLEAGHAAMHRMFKPREEDLTLVLDIVEGVVAAIYIHPRGAEGLAARVTPRRTKGKPPTS
jgi:hypothetical protein